MALNLRTLFSAGIVLTNLLLVVFLFDNKHVVFASLLIPMGFWFGAITQYISGSDYMNSYVLNLTSIISVSAVGLYMYSLSDGLMRHWFMTWYLVFLAIFIDLVFRFRYNKGNEYLFFVVQCLLLFFSVVSWSQTKYVPWDIYWISLIPIPFYFILAFLTPFFKKLTRKQIVLVKAISGTLAIICAGYVASFSEVNENVPCVNDLDCPHGSSKSGTGQRVNSICRCLDASWFKVAFFEICLPCASAFNNAQDCCGNSLTADNIKTLSCGPGATGQVSCVT